MHIRQFGDPILRQIAGKLPSDKITTDDTIDLINNLKELLSKNKYGVGMSAPQIGVSKAVLYVSIKSTPTRPNLEPFEMVAINPQITKTYGNKKQMWEGCCSFNYVFAKVPRYKKIRVKYYDDKAKTHEEDFSGFIAHVLQHEVDHLNGILYVDRVTDKKSFITAKEYKRMIKKGLA